MRSNILALSALLSVTSAAPSGSASVALPAGGRIEGVAQKNGVQAFLGIPFALSPPERFSAPKDPLPFETLKAQKIRPSCIQQFSGDAKAQNFTKSIFSNPMPEESEDCLYLNAWIPAGQAPKDGWDVMFWIYGGNLQFGTAGLPGYSGDVLARNKNVMVVSANYRTNVFGFPNAPGLPAGEANPGFLDQRKALKWTYDNVKSFGGNPSKITLFGESAGGWSVKQLLALPPSPPQFHAAIMQSEAAGVSGGPDSWGKLAAGLNCTGENVLACVRAAPAKSLIDIIAPKNMQFDPVKDDVTCSKNITTAFASDKAAKVPLIIGSNAEDGTLFAVVFGGGDDKAVTPDMGKGITDITFNCPAAFLAKTAVANGFPAVYRYYYNVSESKYDPFFHAGAYHGAEIGLVFGTYPQDRVEFKKTGDLMQGLWTSFAKEPTKSLVGWPKVTKDSYEVMVFGNQESRPVKAETIDTTCAAMLEDILRGGL